MDKEIPVYRNIFLTGKPGAGKSTAIKRIIEEIEKKGINEVSGFLTEEIRGENGVREGFMLKTVDGKREGLLSHIRDIKSKYKVGKYNVSIPNIENIAVPTMALDEGIPLKILIIDEIGKMECFSQVFLDSLGEALESDVMVLGTIAQKGGEIISQIKSRDDTHIINLTKANRDKIPILVVGILSSQLL